MKSVVCRQRDDAPKTEPAARDLPRSTTPTQFRRLRSSVRSRSAVQFDQITVIVVSTAHSGEGWRIRDAGNGRRIGDRRRGKRQ